MKNDLKILVCVTQQKTCEKLIYKAKELTNNKDDDLHILHVAKNNLKFLDNEHESEALNYLFNISKKVGADLMVLKSDDIEAAISNYAKKNNINCVILGESNESNDNSSFYIKLKKLLGEINIEVVSSKWHKKTIKFIFFTVFYGLKVLTFLNMLDFMEFSL